MIFTIIFAVLALMASLGWMYSDKKLKDAQEQIQTLLKSSQISAEPVEEDEAVHTHVEKIDRTQRVTPLDYYALFETNDLGRKVLGDLTARFCHLPYVPGGLEADRESCYRAGQFRVVNFINARIGAAHQPQQGVEHE